MSKKTVVPDTSENHFVVFQEMDMWGMYAHPCTK